MKRIWIVLSAALGRLADQVRGTAGLRHQPGARMTGLVEMDALLRQGRERQNSRNPASWVSLSRKSMKSKLLIGATCGAMWIWSGGAAWAQHDVYPVRPPQIIIPFASGSATDILARYLGGEMGKTLGKPLVVMSKPSSNGVVATEFVKRASADGYTILLGGNTTMSANVFLTRSLPYDPVADFEPVSQLTINPLVLVTRSDLPIKNVEELIAYAKARPGALNYGVGNLGGRMAVQLLESLSGVRAQDISFTGTSQALAELVAGRLDFMITDPLVVDSFVKQGKIRPLAVTSSRRLPMFPDLPTMAQAGVKGYDYASYLAFYVPRGTPPRVIEALNSAVAKAIESEEGVAFMNRMGMIGVPSSPGDMKSFQREQTALWGRLVKEAGLAPQ